MNTLNKKTGSAVLLFALLAVTGSTLVNPHSVSAAGSCQPKSLQMYVMNGANPGVSVTTPIEMSRGGNRAKLEHGTDSAIATVVIANTSTCTFTVNAMRFSLNTTSSAPIVQNIRVNEIVRGFRLGSVLLEPLPGPVHLMPFIIAPGMDPLVLAPNSRTILTVRANILPSAPLGANIFATQLYNVEGKNLTDGTSYSMGYGAGTLPYLATSLYTII